MPGRDNTEKEHNKGDGNQREGKVDKRKQHLLHRKHPAMDLNLLEQRRRPNDGHERLVRRLGHDRERNVTDNQI